MEAHDAIVATVAARVKHFHELQEPFRIYHGSTNSTRRSTRHADNTVETSALDRILSFDKTAKTIVAEPNVPLGALVDHALPHGLVPPVVMEFPTITVGGGFSGTSGESSSFRYGAFDATVNWIEIVLPDGTIARASQTERQDLFWGAASAFGTLGVVTLLEVQLMDARPYVQLEYSLCTRADDVAGRMREKCDKADNDFVDGVVFAMDSTLICTGRMVDEPPKGTSLRRFSRRQDPWFYVRAKKVQEQLKRRARGTKGAPTESDFIPLREYLFRYDRGGFWAARYSFNYFITPFNRVTRYVLDQFMHTGTLYRAMHKSGIADFYMLQDVAVPYDEVSGFYSFLDKSFGIYPIWLCPLHVQRAGGPAAAHGLHAEFARPNAPDLLNFGVWGPLPGSRREVVSQNRALERRVQELGGKKWLYAHAYYPEDEFWALYDRASYDALREQYGAGYLPSVYDKVKVDLEAEEAAAAAGGWRGKARSAFWGTWPTRGLYGVYSAVVGGDYLLQRKKPGKVPERKLEKKTTEPDKAVEKTTEPEQKPEQNGGIVEPAAKTATSG